MDDLGLGGRRSAGPATSIETAGPTTRPALASISLGLAIAVATVVIAAAAQHGGAQGNLSNRQLLVRMGDSQPVIPERFPAELQQLQSDVEQFVSTFLGATVIALDAAVHPTAHETQQGHALTPAAMLAGA